MPQLPHAGIDDRHTGAAALPGLKGDGVLAPGEAREAGIERCGRRVREREQNVVRELPPADLADEALDAGCDAGGGAADRGARRRHCLPRRQLAEVQVGPEAGSGRQIRSIAAVGIAANIVVQKCVEPRQRTVLTRRPARREAGVPRDSGKQFERRQRQAHGARVRQHHCRRGGGRRWQLVERLLTHPPEWRKHPERLPRSVADGPWLEQEVAGMTLDLESPFAQGRLDVGVARDRAWLVAAIPVHAGGARGVSERRQCREARTAQEQQASTARPQGGVKRRERVVQPPAARAARRPGCLFLGRVYVDRQDAVGRGERGGQRAVVGQAQVPSEPDDGGAHGIPMRG